MLPNLQLTEAAVGIYARVKAANRRVGTALGEFDVRIAAQDIANGFTPMTHKPECFDQIPNLKPEDWTTCNRSPPGLRPTRSATKASLQTRTTHWTLKASSRPMSLVRSSRWANLYPKAKKCHHGSHRGLM